MTRIAVLDWDGTMRRNYTIRAWTRFLVLKGIFQETAIAELEAVFSSYQRGEITHDQTAVDTSQVYANHLSRHKVCDVSLLADEYLRIDEEYMTTYCADLLATLQHHGVKVYIVSGAPYDVLVKYVPKYHLAGIYSLEIGVDGNGNYKSEVVSNPGTSTTKKAWLDTLTRIPGNNVVFAAGDSDSDLPLLNAAPYCLVVNNPALKVSSKAWHISTEDAATMKGLLQFLESEVLLA